MRNGAAGIVGIVVAAIVLLLVLKLAFKLALLAAVAVGAVALFLVVRNRIGGPRA